MQDTPYKTGTPLGHMYPVPMELAGVIYTRIHPKVSIKLLWGRKQVKGAHFRDQDDRAEKTDAAQGLEEADAVINRLPLQFIHSFMQFFEYAVQMCLVFLICFYIQLNPERIARERAPESGGILCSSAYGIVFGNGIFLAETCGFAYGFHKFVLWGGKHVGGERVSFKEL